MIRKRRASLLEEYVAAWSGDGLARVRAHARGERRELVPGVRAALATLLERLDEPPLPVASRP